MATLYDRKGNPVEVPDNQVMQALSSGNFGIPENQRLPMIAPDGEVFELSAEDALGASKEGWSFETGEQRRQRELQAKFGGTGGEIAAGAAGIARGLSFGLSDAALTGTGLVDEETLKGLQEANPTAGMVGEIGSVVGSLLIPGMQGQAATKGASLLRGVTAAPRAAARLGMAGERAAARLVGEAGKRGLMGRIGARGAELGAGSAIEGALYGGAEFISEAALGDIDATAENLLGHVGMGAVIGGGFGAGLGSGFQGVKELATGATKLSKKSAESLVKLWEQQTGNKALPGLADAYSKLSGSVTGKMDEVASLMGKETRARSVQSLEVRDKFARDLTDLENVMDDAYEDVFERTTGKPKREIYKDIAESANFGVAKTLADDLVGVEGSMLARIDEIIKGVDEGEFDFKHGWKTLKKLSEKAQRNITEVKNTKEATGQIFSILDDLKRDVGKINKKIAKSIRRGNTTSAAEPSLEEGMRLYKRLADELERGEIWGKQAARSQREYNRKWVAYLEDVRRRPDHRFWESWETTDWEKKTQARPQGFREYIEDMGSIKNDLDEPWLQKQMNTRQDLMDKAVELFDLPVEVRNKVAKAKKALDDFKLKHDDIKKTIGAQNQLRALEEAVRGSGFSTEMGVIGGAILGGPIGAIAGGAIGAVLNPARTVRQLATLERIAGGYKQRIKNGLQRYVNKHKKGAKKIGSKTRRLIAPSSVNILQTTSFGDGQRKSKNKHEAFRFRMEELHAITQSQYGSEQLAKTTETIGQVAPQIAQAIQAKATQAANFLLEKAPKNFGIPTIIGAEWKPSELELTKFSRFVEAVNDPHTVIKRIEDGTLTHESVEAIREVYPKIHQQIVDEIIANIDDLRESLPYQERIQLTMLFGVPIDPTMDPKFIAEMQTSVMASRPQLPQMGQQPSRQQPYTSKPEFNMTQAQRLAAKQGGAA